MNARDRFLETMRFGKPDRIFFMPQWVWGAAVERWHSEGLPRDVHIDEFFGYDRYESVPISLGLIPAFDSEILYEDENYRIVRRADGVLIKEFYRRPDMSMPQWLEFPLKTEEDWEKNIKPRLNPNSPCRYPLWWDDYVRCVKGRDYPLGIHGGSYFGWPRNWMGLENFALAMYDMPDLVHEICNHIADSVLQVIQRAVEEIKPDFALFWEDMSMKTGPLCSPEQFREFMLPCYKKVTGYLRSQGIDILMVDSDGNNDLIVPLWLEGGVNGLYPLEVASDTDPVTLRKKYGKKLVMFGGIDKRVLAQNKAAIEEHVLSFVPWMVSQGGFTPFPDHLVPPDVPFENFKFYWDLVKKIAADPEAYITRV
jgi:uroporphyrinogen decarboxylase